MSSVPPRDTVHSARARTRLRRIKVLETVPITVDMLVWAYCRGIFPMADSRSGEIAWYSPDPRAILPLDGFHVSRSLRRRVRSGQYHITTDQAFERVILACAESRSDGADTWINDEIHAAYTAMSRAALSHSVEAWRDESEQELVGGLYGVALGGAFFGESMFSRARDASKVCLVHLVEHLCRNGFRLLDTQFQTPHLAHFGVVEIPRAEYLERLDEAIRLQASWEGEGERRAKSEERGAKGEEG